MKNAIHPLTPVAALIALAAAQTALAQTSPATTPELAPVVISTSRNETHLEDMPSSTTVITQEDIRKSSAQSVDQLLKTLPGFNFSGAPSYLSDPTGTQTKMRGLGNDKVLVLLDGIPIIDPFYETTQWFRVPMASIERIEIMRGGASSTWGSMAVGGVVNIITKAPKDGAGEVSIAAGMQGTSSVAASKDVVLSDSVSLNMSVSQFNTQGYQTTPAAYLWMYPQKNPPTDMDSAYQLAAFFKPSADLKGFLRVGTYGQNQDLYGVYGINDQQSANVSGGVTKLLDDHSSLDTRFWSQGVAFDKTNGAACYLDGTHCYYGGGTAPPNQQAATYPVGNFYTQYGSQSYSELGASSVYSRSFSGFWNSLQVGVDYRKLSVSDTELYYASPSVANNAFTTQQNLSYTFNGSGAQTFTGVFLQGKFTPATDLQVTVSVRNDDWENTDRYYSLVNAHNATSPGSGPAADLSKSQIDPSIGVHYDLNDDVSLRADAYKAFRAPGLNNQTRSYGSTIANPDLSPETVTGWELGTDFNSGNSKLSVTYFSNTISNMIATSTYTANYPQPVLNLCSTNGSNVSNCSSSGSVSYYTNNQNGQANGLEVNEKWKVRDNLTVDASYAYTSTYLTSIWNNVTTPTNTQLAGIPTSTATVSATWLPVEQVRVFLQAYYMGPLSVQETGNTSGTLLANYTQGSNTIVNGSVNYAYDRATDLYVNVTNLFNRVYQDGTYTASTPWTMTQSPPLSVMFGATRRF